MFISKLKSLPRSYWSLSSLQLLFWAAIAAGTYLTVFLQREGFKPDQVGFINAAISIVAIMATPFWGMIADKMRSIRKVLIFCLSTGLVLWALIPVSSRGPASLIYIVIILGAFFKNPGTSLFDAFSVQRSDLDRLAYGHVRLWGSFSFAAMSFFLSFILPHIGVEFTFYFFGIVLIPLLLIMRNRKGEDTGRQSGPVSFRKMRIGRLFKNYYFITYLLFAIFVYIPMNCMFVFMPYLIDAVGGDTAQLGLLNTCRALVEIPVLLLMRSLRRKLPLPIILGGAAVIYCVDAFLYARVTHMSQIMMLQAFDGIGGALMIGGAANYVYSLAPKDLYSTAQTMNGAFVAFAAITGSMVGGLIIQNMGIFSYYRIMSMMLLFTFTYFYLSVIVGIKILKKPIPSLKVF